MSGRLANPLRDQVAVIGVGTTPYVRDGGTRSRGALVIDACIAALNDAGLQPGDIDGLCGGAAQASPQYVQSGLGIPVLRWWSTPPMPMSLPILEAAHAVFAGACSTAVVYHSQFRGASVSARPDQLDAVRRQPDPARFDYHWHDQYYQGSRIRTLAYAGYMRRYLFECDVQPEHFGRIAVNSRTHAQRNEHAAMRKPLTLKDYLRSPMVNDPMRLLDIDYAVDGGDAFVVTTRDRAESLGRPYALLHSASHGSLGQPEVDRYPSVADTGQVIAAAALWEKAALSRSDVDIVYAYDGFTVIAMKWLESFGFCRPGDAGRLIDESWDEDSNTLRLGGTVPVNTHGGSLSEGATQGAGHLREAVSQLRGTAGPRQVPGARTALLGIGGLFYNSVALLLRAA